MLNNKYCFYCNKELIERSSEHIIQNSLGGLLESLDICCPKCNNFISKHIDVPFSKIFNPIISRIENFNKTNNKKSKPPYTGKILYNGERYTANFKGKKLISCSELSKNLKCDISNIINDIIIIGYDFEIENNSFKQGMSKIALNFAISKGIKFEYLKSLVDIKKNNNAEIEMIDFKSIVLPFVPLNPIDRYLEETKETELYHNLILFNDENNLWCYVDLFNTFKYYILLSEDYYDNKDIYESYLQYVQKIDRTIPKINLNRAKYALIYAQMYGIKPTLDKKKLEQDIKKVIDKKTKKINMKEFFSNRIRVEFGDFVLKNKENFNFIDCYIRNLQLYFDENDSLNPNIFRKLTYNPKYGYISYPYLIYKKLLLNREFPKEYTYFKFNQLTKFLNENK